MREGAPYSSSAALRNPGGSAIRIDRLIAEGPRERIALVHRDRSLTFAELDDLVGRVAGGLVARGIAPGDRVVVWAPKSVESVALLFAAARAGAIFIPAHPQLKAAQVAHIVSDSGAALLITVRARAAGLDALIIEDDFTGLAGAAPVDVARRDDDLAALLYTSGSTGRPKGVMLSHSNLWHAADSVRSYLGTTLDDRVLSVLPHGFDYGLNQLTQAWAAGASAVLLDYLTPRDIVKAVAAHDITQLGAVPPLWHDLAAADWGDAGASLRTLTNSGGHLTSTLSTKLRGLFPQARLWLMYGLTEAFRATALDPALAAQHPDSVGTAIPHARVGLAHADGSEATEGELVQAGPLVARGYWSDAARTAARFRPAPDWLGGGPGVWSGDTLRRDADGLYHFVGRDDEQIKVSGHRISPTEIEEAALASGACAQAVAFGIADNRTGQAVALVATPLGDHAEARLRGHLARVLPSYMQPATVTWRDALPVNANGKLDRAALKRQAT